MRGSIEGFSRFHSKSGGIHLRGFIRNGFTCAAELCTEMDSPKAVLCHESRKVKTALVNGFFLKRYNLPGSWNQFRRFFRTSRPLISLFCAEAFAAAGVKTPKVLAVLTEKRGISRRDILITEALTPECRTANLIFPIPGKIDGGWNIFAQGIFPLLVKLHDCGIAHGDLNIRNIYCNEDFSQWGMIDLDGGILCKKPLPLSMREKELARLASSFVREFPTANLGGLASDCTSRYARLSPLKPDTNRIWGRMEYLLNLC